MKAKISTEWLSGCSGCHVAVVDLHEKLLDLFEAAEFVRLPVLMDTKDYPEAAIGLVEGAVRSEHDLKALIAMRKSVKTLIAFGSCAVYGGPSGVGWLYGKDAIINGVYGAGPTDVPGQRPDGDAAKLAESVVPINEAVKVDFYLPGCPPSPYFIAAGLRTLLGVATSPLSVKSVCSECKRKMKKSTGMMLQKGAITAKDADLCFLSQGVICLGSVTLNRCHAPCPAVGIACTGCNGPSLPLITEPHLDLRNMVAQRMHMLTGIGPEEIKAYFQEDAKTFYAYALASPVIYRKPTVEMREWAGGVESSPQG